jgi:luciferase family oxidoreductase group 1
MMIPLSILDLSPVVQGGTPTQSFQHSLDLARHAEGWGYRRFWVAEHHNMPGIASAATSVVMAYLGAGTTTIRIGAGGIMLPNHAPLQVVEQFGTLESLFPGRIDLGLGRAPGTDPAAARALRRTLHSNPEEFPRDVLEVMAFFRAPEPGQPVRAVPGAGLKVPIWILGSSTFGAHVAAALGLPFAFASHFAPAMLEEAAEIYRQQFRPSEYAGGPHLMLGLNLVAGETDAEARFLFTSIQQAFLNLHRGRPGPLPPPVEDVDGRLSGTLAPGSPLSKAVVGGPDTVRAGLERFIATHRPDEIILTAQIFDQTKRIRSLEIASAARDTLASAA